MKIYKIAQFGTPVAEQNRPALNNRQIQMIEFLNTIANSNVPLTTQGYDQVGRSDGILKELSKPHYLNMLLQNEYFRPYLLAVMQQNKTIPTALTNMFLQIKR